MLFLIDENLPSSVGRIFIQRGFQAESVGVMPELQGQPDEVVFNYAVAKNAVIVTRDLDFTNPFKFDHRQLHGLVILRFPNEISIKRLIDETSDLIADIEEDDFRSLIIIAPGSVRKRKFIV